MSEDLTQHQLNGNLDRILARLEAIDSRLFTLDSRMFTLDSRLVTLEEKVDRRLQETRPIWEGVLEQLKEISARLLRVEDENKDFRRMFRSTYSDMSRVQENLEERIEKLEG